MCLVKGCNVSKVHAKGLCKRHYEINRRHGTPYRRTIWDRNEIEIVDDYAEIYIYNNKCKEIGRTKIDIEDIERVKDYKWHYANKLKYVEAKVDGKNVLLHRLIMRAPSGKEVDHINRDSLDNRKKNLRICSRAENAKNIGLGIKNTSGHSGISWHKRHNKWMASIQVDNNVIYLGYFRDFDDAKKIRIEAEKKYYGKFAPNQGGVV